MRDVAGSARLSSRTSSGPVISGIITSVMTQVECRDRARAGRAPPRRSAQATGSIAQVLERADGRSGDPRIVLDHQDRGAPGTRTLGLRAGCAAGWRADLLGGGVGARQIDRDGRALAERAMSIADLAARLVGEAENLAEAEAGALADRLGGEEGLEHALEMLGRHAAAGVGDADADIVAGRGCRRPRCLGQGDVVDVRCAASPLPSIASRALTARLRIAFSSWCGSTQIGQASGRRSGSGP